jgi:hypothetical protein
MKGQPLRYIFTSFTLPSQYCWEPFAPTGPVFYQSDSGGKLQVSPTIRNNSIKMGELLVFACDILDIHIVSVDPCVTRSKDVKVCPKTKSFHTLP